MENLLLAALHPDDQALLAPHLAPIVLAGGQRLASTSSLARVCFPETLVASCGNVLADGARYEVGMIGREGLVGWPILLGPAATEHHCTVQLAGGRALALPAETLMALCATSHRLHMTLLRFVQAIAVQMEQTIGANLRGGVERRLARWLLMLHDRIDGDRLLVTHSELAVALGVRRASVTDWLHVFEGDRLLRCTRGQMTIRDRAGLRALAGETYGAAEAAYSRLIAPFGRE